VARGFRARYLAEQATTTATLDVCCSVDGSSQRGPDDLVSQVATQQIIYSGSKFEGVMAGTSPLSAGSLVSTGVAAFSRPRGRLGHRRGPINGAEFALSVILLVSE